MDEANLRWYPGAGAMATHGYFSHQKVGVKSPFVSQVKNRFAGGRPSYNRSGRAKLSPGCVPA